MTFWSKRKKENTDDTHEQLPQEELTWDSNAQQALKQASAQAPVPDIMKKKIENELKKAAEEITKKDGRTTVTPEDLMNGLMAKLPANMRSKIEDAAKQGPEGLKKLEKEIGE